MWNKSPPQHSICPSSLTSRACLSHRRRPSTFSLAASTQEAPPNKWLIWQGERFSEVCLCALFSLIISASSVCLLHSVSPVLRGRALKKKATRRSVYTHMTLTDIKRPQAIAVVCKYLVYQALSGLSVSQGTLCLMTHPHILGTSLGTRGDASPGCGTPGQNKREGGSL